MMGPLRFWSLTFSDLRHKAPLSASTARSAGDSSARRRQELGPGHHGVPMEHQRGVEVRTPSLDIAALVGADQTDRVVGVVDGRLGRDALGSEGQAEAEGGGDG